MNPASWAASDLDSDAAGAPGRPQPALVSLHFVRAALRRRRLALVLAAVLGLLAGGAYLALVPPVQRATVTLALAHDPQADPERAMATDLSLAGTRTVAQQVITQLRLTLTPEELLKTVTATPTTSDILTITLVADSRREAVRRLSSFTTGYLEFRSDQLSAQSNLMVKGMNRRIDALQEQVNDINADLESPSRNDSGSESEVADAVTRRAKIGTQIDVLQQSVQDANLRITAIVAGSRVIDQPAAVPTGGKRRIALTLASGLIGGAAVGVGLVLFVAITSDRLRRRLDVVTALGVPVIVSVGRLVPVPRPLHRLPVLRARDARRSEDRQRVARAIESLALLPGRGEGLAIGCVDNAVEVSYGLIAAALNLQSRETTVRLIDLTTDGVLTPALEALLPDDGGIKITVSRPRTAPSLVTDMSELDTLGPESGELWAWGPDDVFLTLADLAPSDGADHVRRWSSRMVIAVSAGNSSVERLWTVGELVRSAGLELLGAILLEADATDESSGNLRRTPVSRVRDEW
jgi:capsular polysaccharide biosynthesis protein